MAPPATELAYITLKPGVDLESDTPEARAWQESLKTVSSQAGFQRSYYGRQLEDPSLLMLVIDWDSKDSHLKFVADPSYGPFKSKLASFTDGVHLHHMTQSDTALLGRAPVIEVATIHDAEDGMLENLKKFTAALDQAKPKGYHGAAVGEVIEKIVRHNDVGKEGVKQGSAVVGLLGWDSKEAHMAFRETELFKENVHLLREKNGGIELGHVPFKAA